MATPINRIKRSDLNFVKQIGEGGFSSVYQMTWIHPSLGPIETAAKKLIKRDVRELDIMSGLDHPNIVKLLGVVDEQMDFMLILELCDKGSLRSYLQELKGKRLSDDQFYDWAEQAARPLEYLRQKCIIHKDVKSPNYMITKENNLKLGDFGIAKNLDQTMNNATETASFRWMAPELLTQNVLSPKYDIFAYGVVLWELRTGKYPFEGQESQVVTWEVCQLNKRLPIPDDCPQPIKDLMKRCWEGDWRRRPSIMEVITVIKAAAAVPVRAAAKEATPATAAATLAPGTTTEVLAPSETTATVATITTTKEIRQQQIITGPWKLEREFGHQDGAFGIAVNPSNSDVAVAHYKSSQVKVYTRNGEYKFNLDTTQELEPWETSYPRQITVNSQGTTYFVTDTRKHVKCYDSIGVFNGHWVSSCPQASIGSPFLYGLAMDHEGHLLVGDCSNIPANTKTF
ncbi:mitogen-activated protein kinase kinase kinase 20-like [Amphiura filiformis]|uniref:mitogen-activated protein kinase kinase kinase 20-like n=1 Tax=Amphiura filiformis TaxID=82378 RepID=UPI003B211C60